MYIYIYIILYYVDYRCFRPQVYEPGSRLEQSSCICSAAKHLRNAGVTPGLKRSNTFRSKPMDGLVTGGKVKLNIK